MAKKKKKTSRAAYWQEHISQWSESGLTQAEYCRRNKLSAAAFHWWKRHLRNKSNAQKDSPTSMQFVEVHNTFKSRRIISLFLSLQIAGLFNLGAVIVSRK